MQRIVLAAFALVLTMVTPAAGKDCDRSCTMGVAQAVLAALQSGDTGKLLPRGLRMTENGRDIRLADSQLRAFRKITFLQAFFEPAAGAAGFNGSAEAFGGPAVFSIRLRLKDGRVSEVETLVVRRTEASVFAPETMAQRPLQDDPLAADLRTSRQTLLAVSNAFLDAVAPGGDAAPLAVAGCRLYENGATPVQGTHCSGIASLRGAGVVRDRRVPLIDEERGLIWSLAVADIPDKTAPAAPSPGLRSARPAPRSLLLSTLLRIEAGRIQEIDLVQRNAPLGAVSGWAPVKPKKGR